MSTAEEEQDNVVLGRGSEVRTDDNNGMDPAVATAWRRKGW
jgi:hypothetical protein